MESLFTCKGWIFGALLMGRLVLKLQDEPLWLADAFVWIAVGHFFAHCWCKV